MKAIEKCVANNKNKLEFSFSPRPSPPPLPPAGLEFKLMTLHLPSSHLGLGAISPAPNAVLLKCVLEEEAKQNWGTARLVCRVSHCVQQTGLPESVPAESSLVARTIDF